MHYAIQAAIARFPDRGHGIEELAGRDDEFRSLCEDLADAGDALVRWQRSSSPVRDERCAEYRELVGDLAVELETMLDRSAKA